MRVSRLIFACPFTDFVDYKALFCEGFLRTDMAWKDRGDHPRTLPGCSGGVGPTSPGYEVFRQSRASHGARVYATCSQTTVSPTRHVVPVSTS